MVYGLKASSCDPLTYTKWELSRSPVLCAYTNVTPLQYSQPVYGIKGHTTK